MLKPSRKFIPGFCLMLALVIPLGLAAQAPTAKTDPEFTAFWSKFKDAVVKNSKERVADMTKLPFMIRNVDYDRAGFIKQYPTLFTPRMRRCFARAKPEKDLDAYVIFCGDQMFLFGKVDGVYKFTDLGVND